jgi:hypothetical protein
VADTETEPINVLQFDTASEAADAVRAAGILDLGVTLVNQLVPDTEDEETFVEQWIVAIYSNTPAATLTD